MRTNLKKIIVQYLIIFLGLFFFLNASPVFAGSADLSWDPNIEPDLAGYKVYYGTSSGHYGTPIDIGNQTTYTVAGLAQGVHYFSVTAYDKSGNESAFSIEVSKTLFGPSTAPPGATPVGESSRFESGGGGGGCGLIHPDKDNPSGPEDSSEMIAMMGFMLLILLRKWLKTPGRIMGLSKGLSGL